MKKKYIVIMILIAFTLIFNILIPVELEGVVESKAVNGRMSGDIVEGIVFNVPYSDEPWIQVENKDFEDFFPSEDKNVFVNDSLHQLMQRKYINIDYIVTIQVKSLDPVNGLVKGQSCAYLVDRSDFNSVKIGDNVTCKISRHKKSTINRIIVTPNLKRAH
ncbi:hypothetical protein [Methanolobus sp. WCC5]|jgi:hypothetical protein|uniref:hypothetical protein n=1 Tax=Methanolobus sp. WCC5 TaxID=3125785 RepID=UPI003245143B